MTDDINALVGNLLRISAYPSPAVFTTCERGACREAITIIKRQQAVVEAARGYGRGEFGWPRRLEKALAALDTPPEGEKP